MPPRVARGLAKCIIQTGDQIVHICRPLLLGPGRVPPGGQNAIALTPWLTRWWAAPTGWKADTCGMQGLGVMSTQRPRIRRQGELAGREEWSRGLRSRPMSIRTMTASQRLRGDRRGPGETWSSGPAGPTSMQFFLYLFLPPSLYRAAWRYRHSSRWPPSHSKTGPCTSPDALGQQFALRWNGTRSALGQASFAQPRNQSRGDGVVLQPAAAYELFDR